MSNQVISGIRHLYVQFALFSHHVCSIYAGLRLFCPMTPVCPSIHIKLIGVFRSKRITDQYEIKLVDLFSEVKTASKTSSSL